MFSVLSTARCMASPTSAICSPTPVAPLWRTCNPESRTVSFVLDTTTANSVMFAIAAHAAEREAHTREVERFGQTLPEGPTAGKTVTPSLPAKPGSPPACGPSNTPTA